MRSLLAEITGVEGLADECPECDVLARLYNAILGLLIGDGVEAALRDAQIVLRSEAVRSPRAADVRRIATLAGASAALRLGRTNLAVTILEGSGRDFENERQGKAQWEFLRGDALNQLIRDGQGPVSLNVRLGELREHRRKLDERSMMRMVIDGLLGDLLLMESPRRPSALDDAEATYLGVIEQGRLSETGDTEAWSSLVFPGGKSGRRVLAGRAWLGLAEVRVQQARTGSADSRLRKVNEALVAYKQAVELMDSQDRDRFLKSYIKLLEGFEGVVDELLRDLEYRRRELVPQER